MRRITVSLDVDLAIEVMVLTGAGSPQDGVELVVRDYVAHAHRTEAITGQAPDARRSLEDRQRGPESG